MTAPDWIAVELSFAELRIWLMRGAEVVEARTPVNATIATLPDLLSSLPDIPLYIADLTGKLTQADAPSVPCAAKLQAEKIALGARQIYLAQGVRQTNPVAAMHGQTAYIAGILAAVPQFDGVICVTGQHSFWSRISAGEICYFQGYLTGELLDYIGGAEFPEDAAKLSDFQSAVDDALSRPHRAYGRLLALRGKQENAAAELAGLLIGLELADAKSYWLGETVMVVGSPALVTLYTKALRHQGVTVHEPDRDAALLAGLYNLSSG